jgi:hypothetical protein
MLQYTLLGVILKIMNEFFLKNGLVMDFKPMKLSKSKSKNFTCEFKKHAIIWSNVFFLIGQFQMKCLKVKCIETFPIVFFIFLI